MKDLPVCPLCGSSNTIKVKDFYHCNDCLSDFGRQPKADDGTPMIEAVKGLRFKFPLALSVKDSMKRVVSACMRSPIQMAATLTRSMAF